MCAQGDPSDLDSDLRTRLQETMLRASLRPVDVAGAQTLIKPPEPEGPPIRRGQALTAASRQEISLLPLPEDPDGVLGEGGQAVVYSYVQRELGREVAVKTLRPQQISVESIETLIREACVTARLEHPNIVPVHYLHLPDHDDDAPYWVMKRIRGRPLSAHLPKGEDPWPVARLLDVFRRIVDAVAFAHSRGVVHRDLKPDNVLVGEFGEVQVTDWGLAVALTEEGAQGATPSLSTPGQSDVGSSPDPQSDDSLRLSPAIARLNEQVRSGSVGAPLRTRAAGRAGTPAYMAPEQLDLTAERIDQRTDVFLLGGVLYSILTGLPPHDLSRGDDTDALKARVREIRTCSTISPTDERRGAAGLPIVPEGLSTSSLRELSEIVIKALSEDLEDRFEGVEAFVSALDEWEARSTSQSLYEQAQARMSQAEGSGRRRATVCAEVMALADASLEQWQGNQPARELRNGAAAQLSAIQRRSSRRLWTAAAAIALVFLVGAIGYQQTRSQWNRAEEQKEKAVRFAASEAEQRKQADAARKDAEAKSEQLAEQKKELAKQLDDAYWEAYEKFGSRNDPVGQLLAAGTAQSRAEENGIISPRWWGHVVRRLMACAPRLAGSSPMSCEWYSLVYSPNGRNLAGGGGDGTIKLWDPASGAEKAALKGHSSRVLSVAFSPDGQTLASGSRDYTIKLWDLASTRRGPDASMDGYGAERATLKGHRGEVGSVGFSPDGQTLASGAADRTIKLWDLASGAQKTTLKGHLGAISSVAFSLDGQTLASGSSDRTIKLWDPDSGAERATLRGHSSRVTGVAFSPDGQTLASGSQGGTIKLWDVATGEEKTTLKGHQIGVESVAFSPDGQTLAAGGYDIKLWDLASGEERATLKGHSNDVKSVAFSPDGQTLASGSVDQTIKFWDLASGTQKATLKGHSNVVTSVAFSPDGQTLASGSWDHTIKLWDMASRVERATLKGHSSRVTGVAFSPDGQTLASGSWDHTIKLWDLASAGQVADGSSQGYGVEKATLKGHSNRVESVAFSPDGKTLASGSSDHTIKLWDLSSDAEKATLEGHSRAVLSVAFSPDGRSLAAAGGGTVKLWDARTGQLKARLAGEGTVVAFSPEGGTLASARRDTVELWDASTGQLRARLKGHRYWMTGLEFCPDGSTLLFGSVDTIKLWNTRTGQVRTTIAGHRRGSYVFGISLSPDGGTLASASSDRTIVLWDLSPVSTMAIDEASRLTGAGLRGFEVAPLPEQTYSPQTANPYLQVRWSKRHAAHWLPRAKQGGVEALYHLAVIRERLGQHEEAIRLHKRTAASTDPAGEQWAAKSRQRLKTIPWLQP